MRQDWDDYFIEIAEKVATRATCDRAHVGSVIVRKDHSILSTGYNGSAPGEDHCDDAGHLMVNNSCKRTTHSEDNAIKFAQKYGIYDQIDGCTIYITHSPCTHCMGKLVAAGIRRIVYKNVYTKCIKEVKKICERCNIQLEQIRTEKQRAEVYTARTAKINSEAITEIDKPTKTKPARLRGTTINMGGIA